MAKKTIYYHDEINEDFSFTKKEPIVVDEKFKYVHTNIFWRILAFIVYRVFMTPFSYVYTKIRFHNTIKNKSVIKPYRKSAYFLYGNHTQVAADGFIPNWVSMPKDCYFITNPENVSAFGTKNLMQMLGVMPLSDNIGGMRNFLSALKTRVKQKNCIVIYPEAHIWPYYTKIRSFTSASFRFPIKYECPTFCFTNTYVKRRISKRPKIVTYVDGPFFPNEELGGKAQQEELRDRVFAKMTERSANSDCEYIEYIHKEKETPEII